MVRLESTKPLLELDEEAGDILEDARKRLPIEFIYDEVSDPHCCCFAQVSFMFTFFFFFRFPLLQSSRQTMSCIFVRHLSSLLLAWYAATTTTTLCILRLKATSSTVSIIASMLISPLMGPILGFTFGTILHDKALVKQGLISEIAGTHTCKFDD